MTITLTIISELLLTLLAVYICVAFVVVWRHHGRSPWRFLPLAAASGLAAAALAPSQHSTSMEYLALPLLAAACVQTWRSRARLDRSLHILSTFWLLWGGLALMLAHL